ncbi:BgtE-292 [Blumeria graminis f. sp. tritici]|uniref:BgtE-292 n=4 Tax=Blumeria graminis TaxID=34373 RepID=A0A9X9QFS4_BLUGR|nr:BgtE-292 [Blumeria graminis f. sp. tritici]
MLQTDLVYKYISPEPEQLQTCWENIKDTVKSLGGARVKYSDLEHTICTPKTISYLAYTDSVSVIGDYRHFFPRREYRAQRPIVVSERFSLDQLIEKDHIFRRTDWDDTSVALAWYQGYLHLFEARLNGWYPLTKIGQESQNGRMIFMYMLGTDLGIWNSNGRLSTRINDQLKKLKDESEFKHFYNRLWDTDYPHTLGKQLDLAKLQPIVPMGKIGRDI